MANAVHYFKKTEVGLILSLGGANGCGGRDGVGEKKFSGDKTKKSEGWFSIVDGGRGFFFILLGGPYWAGWRRPSVLLFHNLLKIYSEVSLGGELFDLTAHQKRRRGEPG